MSQFHPLIRPGNHISELLMIGIPTFQVAKMAGTSLREIERSYGHFFNQNLAEAQAKLDEVRRQHALARRREIGGISGSVTIDR